MIEAAIFDMDGLLVDSEPFWRKAEIRAFSEVGLTLSENDCRETMGYRLNEVVELWFARQPWTEKSIAEVEERIMELVSHFILTEATPLPGVQNAIAICRKAGLKIAIASSSPMKLIKSVVKRFQYADVFDLLHSAQYEDYGKPHPAVFITTANKLEVIPEKCLVFEDAVHGVIAGLAAKMKVVAVPAADDLGKPKYAAADLILHSLAEFREEHILKLS